MTTCMCNGYHGETSTCYTCGGARRTVPAKKAKKAKKVVGERVKMFAYGTLRHGGGAFPRSWAASAEVADPIPAVAKGVMWSNGSYPYVAFATTDTEGLFVPGVVVGEILTLDSNDQMWDTICQVELGAGYRMITVPVVVVEDGSTDFVMAWDVGHRFHIVEERYERVPSGDWMNVRT